MRRWSARRRRSSRGVENWAASKDKTSKIDYRWFGNDLERMLLYAAELVALALDVTVVVATPATVEVLRVTRTIPIVFTNISDPVGSGIVGGAGASRRSATSLNWPERRTSQQAFRRYQ